MIGGFDSFEIFPIKEEENEQRTSNGEIPEAKV